MLFHSLQQEALLSIPFRCGLFSLCCLSDYRLRKLGSTLTRSQRVWRKRRSSTVSFSLHQFQSQVSVDWVESLCTDPLHWGWDGLVFLPSGNILALMYIPYHLFLPLSSSLHSPAWTIQTPLLSSSYLSGLAMPFTAPHIPQAPPQLCALVYILSSDWNAFSSPLPESYLVKFIFIRCFPYEVFWNGSSSWSSWSPFRLLLVFVTAAEANVSSPKCFIFGEYSLALYFMFLRKANSLPCYLLYLPEWLSSFWAYENCLLMFLTSSPPFLLPHAADTLLMLTSGYSSSVPCSLMFFIYYSFSLGFLLLVSLAT